MFSKFSGLLGGGLIETALHLCGFLFIACAVLPNVRSLVFGLLDSIRDKILPRPAPVPSPAEFARAVAEEIKKNE